MVISFCLTISLLLSLTNAFEVSMRTLDQDRQLSRDQIQFKGKLSFLFNIRDNLNMPAVWNKFFSEAPQEMYSIYYHSSFKSIINLDQQITAFRVPRVRIDSDEYDTFKAWTQLIKMATINDKNQKFILLTDSSIPIFNFFTIYEAALSNDYTLLQAAPFELGKDTLFPTYSRLLSLFSSDEVLRHSATMILRKDHAILLLKKNEEILNTFRRLRPMPDPNNVLIGTYLKKEGLSEELRNHCIAYNDFSTDFDSFDQLITYEDLGDAQIDCLFYSNVTRGTKIQDDAFQRIFKLGKPQAPKKQDDSESRQYDEL
ncbi:core-2 i-branching beta--n-acetylglucosaminyltransferase family protein [Stylonychia lemnae]|uniref:Core-2 i-branching beta--n-acetylglucosaminyltransferase family protein n=1 Tax=Stylonychia lemnae TaxID=5949 RepID=A0A078A9N2_STYLE|nr:core-2 i-branching beta--n-acetylglucosaminyltransferase family protein [Stylonychia lemnae]|eukprot:CDW78297.1 core-2 i-branching beta--n-acetylglucosaminyltransferase family protein [Stylonychia lemnae]